MIESRGDPPEQVGAAEFRRLLLAGTPFIDVRAEIEFGDGVRRKLMVAHAGLRPS